MLCTTYIHENSIIYNTELTEWWQNHDLERVGRLTSDYRTDADHQLYSEPVLTEPWIKQDPV